MYLSGRGVIEFDSLPHGVVFYNRKNKNKQLSSTVFCNYIVLQVADIVSLIRVRLSPLPLREVLNTPLVRGKNCDPLHPS